MCKITHSFIFDKLSYMQFYYTLVARQHTHNHFMAVGFCPGQPG